MVLSWSGTRLQHVINDRNASFFHQEREKTLSVLRSRGVIHGDCEWRNMLWDDQGGRLVVIDLEDVISQTRRRAHEAKSGNARHGHLAKAIKSGTKVLPPRINHCLHLTPPTPFLPPCPS